MDKVKKLFVLLLIAAIVSLGVTGCKKKSETPTKETPTKETTTEETPSEDHPAGEHPE